MLAVEPGAGVRRGDGGEIGLFLALTFGLSGIFYFVILRAGTLATAGGLPVAGLMWCPGTAALVVTFLRHRSLRGLGWGRGPWRFWLYGYGSPILYAGIVYALVWWGGLGGIDHEVAGRLAQPKVPALLVLGSVTSSLTALGEELGWRGFLLPRLVGRYGFVRATLATGGIWAVWHYPLLLWGDYHGGTPLAFSLLCFTVLVLGISFLLAWLRLASDSVWPAMLLHASHNLYIQGIFDRLTVDTGPTEWWIGEFGAGLALVAIAVGLLALALHRRGARPGNADVEEPIAG